MSDDLIKILTENELAECIPILEQNKLTTKDLLAEVTEADYEKIGVSALGDRKKLLKLFFKTEKQEQSASKEQTPSQATPTVIVEQKKTHGVWIFVGVLIAILLVIGIISSL
jgi:hypothetical protein